MVICGVVWVVFYVVGDVWLVLELVMFSVMLGGVILIVMCVMFCGLLGDGCVDELVLLVLVLWDGCGWLVVNWICVLFVFWWVVVLGLVFDLVWLMLCLVEGVLVMVDGLWIGGGVVIVVVVLIGWFGMMLVWLVVKGVMIWLLDCGFVV